MPLQVIRTKSRSIWDDINPFIDKLTAAYKQSQENKWNNEWQLSALADIENANKPQEVIDFLELQKIPEDNLDISGFTQFANDCMGMLAKQEMMFEDDKPLNAQAYGGGVGATPGMEAPKPDTMLPQPTPVRTTRSMPDVKEFNNLYKLVSELPTGKVDWTNTLDLFKEKLESGRAMGSAAQQFLSMIMGQSMPTNQRQKVQEDVGFTQDLHNILYETEKAPASDYERWKADPEGFAEFKAVGKEEEKTFDFEKFLETYPDWEIGSINAKGEPTLKRKEQKADFNTYEEAQEFIDTHKQPGYQYKIDPQAEGFNVLPEKVSVTPQGGTDKLVPTYETINSIAKDLSNPDTDYDTAMHNAQIKYDLTGAKLPTKADQAKRAYDMFEGIITDVDDPFIDEKGMVKNPEAYADFYKDYEKFSEVYFKETGQILPKKYVSIEEAGKYTTRQWATGKYKGGEKPVRNEDNIPWAWQKETDVTQELYNEMQRTGMKPEDYDLEALAKEQGIDIEKLLKMFGK